MSTEADKFNQNVTMLANRDSNLELEEIKLEMMGLGFNQKRIDDIIGNDEDIGFQLLADYTAAYKRLSEQEPKMVEQLVIREKAKLGLIDRIGKGRAKEVISALNSASFEIGEAQGDIPDVYALVGMACGMLITNSQFQDLDAESIGLIFTYGIASERMYESKLNNPAK